MTKQAELKKRVLEGMSTVVLLFDADLTLNYINPAGEMLFEQSARHLLGLSFVELIQHRDEISASKWIEEVKSGQYLPAMKYL